MSTNVADELERVKTLLGGLLNHDFRSPEQKAQAEKDTAAAEKQAKTAAEKAATVAEDK